MLTSPLGIVTLDDFKDLKSPISVACVGKRCYKCSYVALLTPFVVGDPYFADTLREQAEDMLAATELRHEFKVYEGVPHGIDIKYGPPDAPIMY